MHIPSCNRLMFNVRRIEVIIDDNKSSQITMYKIKFDDKNYIILGDILDGKFKNFNETATTWAEC